MLTTLSKWLKRIGIAILIIFFITFVPAYLFRDRFFSDMSSNELGHFASVYTNAMAFTGTGFWILGRILEIFSRLRQKQN